MKKKILSLLTTFCMIFALFATNGLPVSALEKTDTQIVTVNQLVEGTEVNAYKVIDLNVNENGSILDPTYTWDTDIANWVETNHSTYIGKNNAVTDVFTKLSDEDSKTFWQDLGKYIKGASNITADQTATVAKGATSVELTLGMGEYVLLANGGTNKIYTPATVAVLPKKNDSGDFELDQTNSVNMKGEDISVEKTIPDPNEQSVGVGSVVNYEITNTIPTYPTNVDTDSIKYVFGDNMSIGLTFNGNVEVLLDGQAVEQNNYELKTSNIENPENDFEVSFKHDFILKNAGKTIKLKYSATVNENAVTGTNPLDNTVTLKYTRDPYNTNDFETLTDKETVYTYNIQFDKVNDKDEALNDAEFELYQSNGATKINLVKESEGVYRLAKDGESNYVTTLTSTNTGNFLIKGLDTGTYVLKETKSPDGYILPTGNKVTITLVDQNGTGSKPDGQLDMNSTKADASGLTLKNQTINEKLTFSFDVVNKTAGDLNLPITGGSGIMMFTVGGLAVMAGAVLLYVNNRRKSNVK